MNAGNHVGCVFLIASALNVAVIAASACSEAEQRINCERWGAIALPLQTTHGERLNDESTVKNDSKLPP